MTADLDPWGQPAGIGPHPPIRARRRSYQGIYGVMWVSAAAGPRPSYVRRQFRRHPDVAKLAGVIKEEL